MGPLSGTETCRSRENWYRMNSESVFRKMPEYLSFSSPPTHRIQSTSQQEHLFFTLWKLKSVTEKAKGTLNCQNYFFFPVTYKVGEKRMLTTEGELYSELN